MTEEIMLKKLYEQGQAEFYDGGREENNPYHSNPVRARYSMWNQGFRDAQDDVEDWLFAFGRLNTHLL